MSSDPEKPEPPVRSSSLSYQSRPKPPHHSESLSLERHIHHLHEPTSPLQRHKETTNTENLATTSPVLASPAVSPTSARRDRPHQQKQLNQQIKPSIPRPRTLSQNARVGPSPVRPQRPSVPTSRPVSLNKTIEQNHHETASVSKIDTKAINNSSSKKLYEKPTSPDSDENSTKHPPTYKLATSTSEATTASATAQWLSDKNEHTTSQNLPSKSQTSEIPRIVKPNPRSKSKPNAAPRRPESKPVLATPVQNPRGMKFDVTSVQVLETYSTTEYNRKNHQLDVEGASMEFNLETLSQEMRTHLSTMYDHVVVTLELGEDKGVGIALRGEAPSDFSHDVVLPDDAIDHAKIMVISRIVEYGAAHENGNLCVGDILVSIGEEELLIASHERVVSVLDQCRGTVQITLWRKRKQNTLHDDRRHDILKSNQNSTSCHNLSVDSGMYPCGPLPSGMTDAENDTISLSEHTKIVNENEEQINQLKEKLEQINKDLESVNGPLMRGQENVEPDNSSNQSLEEALSRSRKELAAAMRQIEELNMCINDERKKRLEAESRMQNAETSILATKDEYAQLQQTLRNEQEQRQKLEEEVTCLRKEVQCGQLESALPTLSGKSDPPARPRLPSGKSAPELKLPQATSSDTVNISATSQHHPQPKPRPRPKPASRFEHSASRVTPSPGEHTPDDSAASSIVVMQKESVSKNATSTSRNREVDDSDARTLTDDIFVQISETAHNTLDVDAHRYRAMSTSRALVKRRKPTRHHNRTRTSTVSSGHVSAMFDMPTPSDVCKPTDSFRPNLWQEREGSSISNFEQKPPVSTRPKPHRPPAVVSQTQTQQPVPDSSLSEGSVKLREKRFSLKKNLKRLSRRFSSAQLNREENGTLSSPENFRENVSDPPKESEKSEIPASAELDNSSPCKWSVEQVCTWIEDLQNGEFSKYSSLFRDQDIHGKKLLEADSTAALKAIGVKSIGHRTILKKLIGDLKTTF